MRGLDEVARDREPRLSPLRLVLLTCASLIAPAIEMIQEAGRRDVDLLVIIAASAVLFGLVVARMAGLVRQQERFIGARARPERRGRGARRRDDARGDLRRRARVGARAARRARRGRSSTRPARRCPDGLVLELAAQGETCALLVVEPSPSRAVRGALQSLATQVSLALDSAALSEEIHRRAGEARFSSLVQNSSDLITVVDSDATVLYQSPSIEHVLGYTPEELVGTRFDRLAAARRGGPPAAPARRRRRVRRRAPPRRSSARCVTATAASATSRSCTRTCCTTTRCAGSCSTAATSPSARRSRQQLAHQAFHDPVTDLANRALFAERVRHAVARARREHNGLAVIFLDLDDFKTVNDSLGHAAGDQVLREVARRLDANIRSSDTAARFGGDEFAILMEDVSSAQEAADTAERILAALGAPMTVDRTDLLVRCSIGISVSQGEAPERRRRADAQRRRGDVHRQARRQGRLPPVRAGDARGRARAPGAARRPAARDDDRPARAALPAGRAACTTARSRASRRCCAGATPSAGWSRPTTSSRSPRRWA